MTATLAEFVNKIYKDAPQDTYVAWGSIDNPMFFSVEELFEQVADGLDLPQDQDVYYTPATFSQAKRRKETFAGAGCLWADADVYKGAVEPLLPPTFRIRSGNGEHFIWVLDQFWTIKEDIEGANKALLAHINRENEGTFNVSRFLRVPGSNNCKYKDPEKYPDYKEPLPCFITEFTPANIYSLSDLAKLQPYNPDLLTTPTLPNGQLDRSARDWALVKTLVKWGLQDYAIEAALTHYSDKAAERPDYVKTTIAKARAAAVEELGKPPKAPRAPKQEDDKALLNAEIEPVAYLARPDGKEEGIVLHVFWDGGSVYYPATAKEFNGGKSVIDWLGRAGAPTRTFFGSDDKAKKLYANLVAQCPQERMLQVDHGGRYDLEDGTRLFIYERTKALTWPPEKQMKIIWKPPISRNIRLQLDSTPLEAAQAERLLNTIQRVQVPEVNQLALGWALMCPLKPVVEECGARMPAMLLYGFPGSGKSSLIEFVMLPLVGLIAKAQAASSSRFSLIATLIQFNAIAGWLGEYRKSNMNSEELLNLLRELYDAEFESRGRADQTINDYALVAPVLIDGESPFDDPANIERSLQLELIKANVETGTAYWQAFQEVLSLPMSHFKRFAYSYLSWTLTLGPEDLRPRLEAARLLFLDVVGAPRIVNSLAIAWVGLTLLREFVTEQGWEVEVKQDRDAFVKALNFSYTPGLGIRTTADSLVEQVSHHPRHQDVGIEYEPERGIVWFNLTRAVTTFRTAANASMLRIQLEQRKQAYIVGPERRSGGAEYWGIDVAKAHSFGLDVYAKFLNAQPEVGFSFDENGVGI